MLNISPLLYTSVDNEDNLHNELDLRKGEKEYIVFAKQEVRKCLREGIPGVLKGRGYDEKVPTPRFFTQGSWAYRTLNAPAQNPQQADIDDGCYLPMSFMEQTSKPSIAAKVFFSVVEEALVPLIQKHGWSLEEKDTCVRLVIADYAHLDIPLYAIPDKEFTKLAKASMESYGYNNIAEAVVAASRDSWTELASNEVLLAHRKHDWMPSDPRPIKDWFLGEVDAKGEQLRRIVRYLKAFRDWKWPSGGPSSILLMSAAVPVFEKRDRRDDLALLDVVSELPNRLREGVSNPVDGSESLTERLGERKTEEAAQAFEELENGLRSAIHNSSKETACALMREAFGERFPSQASRIAVCSVAAAVESAPAERGPSELVGRTKAG